MRDVYYPIPFFNVDNEGNLHLGKEWPIYKEFLNKDLPINNLINSVDKLVKDIGIDRAKDLVPSNVLSLIGNKNKSFQLSVTVAVYYSILIIYIRKYMNVHLNYRLFSLLQYPC